MSLTEFLFALHHGKPLTELTSDVRGALGNLGLGANVRAVWLVNALGLRAPATLLASDEARNHAAKIAERGIVPVEVGLAGLRLAPPAIAWPMVGTWLGEGHQLQHLADALAYVLKAWLDVGDEENAARFLRELWGTEWLIDERPVGHGNPFIQLKRREVLRVLYRLHRRDFGDQPAPATIPVWLELNEAFSLMLLPDPVACAMELFSKPENEQRRKPLLAALVWLAAESRRKSLGDDARRIIGDYFLTPMAAPGTGRALMRLVRDTKKLPEARRVAETWLKLLPDHPEALEVAGALVKRAGSSDEFLAWAMECFTQPSEVRPGAAKLLTTMLEGRPHGEVARQRATAWAWSHALEPQTGILWRTLLMEGLAKEDVLRGAARWLAANATHPEADAMRTRVLKHYPQAFEAAWVMQEWLRDHSADETAADWLLKLLGTQPNNRKASSLALEWVSHALAHPASPKVLRILFKHPDLEVQAVAERWLDANPDSSSHAELLSVIIRNMRSVPKWMERGEVYAGNPQRPGREHIIASLLAAHDCQPRHVRMALQLLPELRTSPRTFLETALGRSLARNLAQAGKMFCELAGTPQALDLAHILSRGLVQFADLQGEFARRVLPVMDKEAASRILFHLVRADVRSPEIISTLVEWLQKNYRQQGYTSLLAALNNHPHVWKYLLGTRRLDQRVIADHKNFRNRPSEEIGSDSNITGVGIEA